MPKFYSQCTDLQKLAVSLYPNEEVVDSFKTDEAALDQVGDTLFEFIVIEAGEAETETELSGMIDRAARQLRVVWQGLAL